MVTVGQGYMWVLNGMSGLYWSLLNTVAVHFYVKRFFFRYLRVSTLQQTNKPQCTELVETFTLKRLGIPSNNFTCARSARDGRIQDENRYFRWCRQNPFQLRLCERYSSQMALVHCYECVQNSLRRRSRSTIIIITTAASIAVQSM